METQKRALVLLKGDYMGFHVSLGECRREGGLGRVFQAS